MDFEWDEQKSETAFRERGFDFDFAIGICAGPIIEIEDVRKDYGETRIKAVGETHGFVLAVIYTDRLDTRRIISARLANKKERTLWRSSAAH